MRFFNTILVSILCIITTFAQQPDVVEILYPAKVIIKKSNNFSVKILDTPKVHILMFDTIQSTENNDSATNDIIAVTNKNKLILKPRNGAINYLSSLPKIEICLPHISKIVAKNAGTIKLTGNFTLKSLLIDNEGANIIHIDSNVSIQNLAITNKGTGLIKLLSPKHINYAKINISGASGFSAAKTPIANVDVVISGAAYCKIFVTDNLIAKVTGFSVLEYRGKPKYKKIASDGLVVIKQLN